MKIKVISKKSKSEIKYLLKNEITDGLLLKVNKNVLAIMGTANYPNISFELGQRERSYDDCLFALQKLMDKGEINLNRVYLRNGTWYLSTFRTVQVGLLKLKFWIGKVGDFSKEEKDLGFIKRTKKGIATSEDLSVLDKAQTVITISIATRSKPRIGNRIASLLEEKRKKYADKEIDKLLSA